jgi:RNA polymerase sigma factor (sigma-70 family)
VSQQIGNNPADRQLVAEVLRGNTQAFGDIIKNTEALVARIVFKMIPNVEDRKDIAQDVYLKAFDKLKGFRFQCKLSTWIAQIAYNTCLSWLEKKKLIFPNIQDDGENNDEALEILHSRSVIHAISETEQQIRQKELSGILKAEIAGLPPVYQTLVALFHQEELSYLELAQISGLPEGTVKSYLFRARKILKENLLSKYKKEAL